MIRTQNKENYYYVFWIVAMIAFITPQVITALAYHRLADYLNDRPIKVRVVDGVRAVSYTHLTLPTILLV